MEPGGLALLHAQFAVRLQAHQRGVAECLVHRVDGLVEVIAEHHRPTGAVVHERAGGLALQTFDRLVRHRPGRLDLSRTLAEHHPQLLTLGNLHGEVERTLRRLGQAGPPHAVVQRPLRPVAHHPELEHPEQRRPLLGARLRLVDVDAEFLLCLLAHGVLPDLEGGPAVQLVDGAALGLRHRVHLRDRLVAVLDRHRDRRLAGDERHRHAVGRQPRAPVVGDEHRRLLHLEVVRRRPAGTTHLPTELALGDQCDPVAGPGQPVVQVDRRQMRPVELARHLRQRRLHRAGDVLAEPLAQADVEVHRLAGHQRQRHAAVLGRSLGELAAGRAAHDRRLLAHDLADPREHRLVVVLRRDEHLAELRLLGPQVVEGLLRRRRADLAAVLAGAVPGREVRPPRGLVVGRRRGVVVRGRVVVERRRPVRGRPVGGAEVRVRIRTRVGSACGVDACAAGRRGGRRGRRGRGRLRLWFRRGGRRGLGGGDRVADAGGVHVGADPEHRERVVEPAGLLGEVVRAVGDPVEHAGLVLGGLDDVAGGRGRLVDRRLCVVDDGDDLLGSGGLLFGRGVYLLDAGVRLLGVLGDLVQGLDGVLDGVGVGLDLRAGGLDLLGGGVGLVLDAFEALLDLVCGVFRVVREFADLLGDDAEPLATAAAAAAGGLDVCVQREHVRPLGDARDEVEQLVDLLHLLAQAVDLLDGGVGLLADLAHPVDGGLGGLTALAACLGGPAGQLGDLVRGGGDLLGHRRQPLHLPGNGVETVLGGGDDLANGGGDLLAGLADLLGGAVDVLAGVGHRLCELLKIDHGLLDLIHRPVELPGDLVHRLDLAVGVHPAGEVAVGTPGGDLAELPGALLDLRGGARRGVGGGVGLRLGLARRCRLALLQFRPQRVQRRRELPQLVRPVQLDLGVQVATADCRRRLREVDHLADGPPREDDRQRQRHHDQATAGERRRRESTARPSAADVQQHPTGGDRKCQQQARDDELLSHAQDGRCRPRPCPGPRISSHGTSTRGRGVNISYGTQNRFQPLRV